PAYREGHEPEAPSADQIALITDTVGDVKHAMECGVRAIGVAWGMHTEQQLLAAGAEFVAVLPQGLLARPLPGRLCPGCIRGPLEAGSTSAPSSSGCACGCQDTDLADAAKLRRLRRMAATASIDQRTSCGAIESYREADTTSPASTGSADRLLLASLRRL